MHPFDLRIALFAKHAQHVALVHFPIGLFIVGAIFDFLAQNASRARFAMVAYYNFLAAAISAVPVIATGILAWQLQLAGQKPKGVLLLHLILGCASAVLMTAVWYWHVQSRKHSEPHRPVARLMLEALTVAAITLTGHLGGFLSGVNTPS